MPPNRRKFVSTPVGVYDRQQNGTSLAGLKQTMFGCRMEESQSLYKRDLRGHFGCVNAIEFSTDGELIASGGDDRRLLLWNLSRTIFDDKAPQAIDTLHISNINSCCFDADNKKVSTGGNDGQVIVHDLSVCQSTAVYGLSDAVYCLSPDPINATIIATATDDGKAQILDLRMSIDTPPFVLADLSTAMHSVMFNPAEPRLLATANSKHGIGLWDIRMPLRCLQYKSSVQNCMSVRFNSRGDQLLALRRRSSPVLYDISKMHPLYEFDYKTYYNACTLKSCSFAGLKDEYVMSGSDDFCIYLWKIPTDISENYIQSEPHLILKGHRSIVNQVRYCPDNQVIISSGVEKLIKMWSPYYIPGCSGHLLHSRRYGDDEVERNAYSHEEYIHMVLQAGSFLSHDYTNGSTEEEPCMIAFFDSLIQREVEQSTEGDEDGEDSSDDGEGPKHSPAEKHEGNSSTRDATVSTSSRSRDATVSTSSRSRDATVSTSSRLENSSGPYFWDLESSSSDSEGEVDVILSAMYSRYMSARDTALSSDLRPSGKKISSVIAKGKQKDHTNRKKMHSGKLHRLHKDLTHGGNEFLRENARNMNILADVIDNFVDTLVARDSSNSQALSDTNDGHLSTDSGGGNGARESTPVEVIQQTLTLHTNGSARGSTAGHLVGVDNGHHLPVVPVTLESGMYFMPELQAFAPESFNIVTNLGHSTHPSQTVTRNRNVSVPHRRISTASLSDQTGTSSSRSQETVHSNATEIHNGALDETKTISDCNGSPAGHASPTLPADTLTPADHNTTSLAASHSGPSCRAIKHKPSVTTSKQNGVSSANSLGDRKMPEVNKYGIKVPFRRTVSCSDNSPSTSSAAGSHYLGSASSSSETVTTADGGFDTAFPNLKPMSVQFKKVKVKGKRFRVHGSKLSSSSDEDK